jgi:hypothetical protein
MTSTLPARRGARGVYRADRRCGGVTRSPPSTPSAGRYPARRPASLHRGSLSVHRTRLLPSAPTAHSNKCQRPEHGQREIESRAVWRCRASATAAILSDDGGRLHRRRDGRLDRRRDGRLDRRRLYRQHRHGNSVVLRCRVQVLADHACLEGVGTSCRTADRHRNSPALARWNLAQLTPESGTGDVARWRFADTDRRQPCRKRTAEDDTARRALTVIQHRKRQSALAAGDHGVRAAVERKVRQRHDGGNREGSVLGGGVTGDLLGHPQHHRRHPVGRRAQLRFRLPGHGQRDRDEGLEVRPLIGRPRHIDLAGGTDRRIALSRERGVDDVRILQIAGIRRAGQRVDDRARRRDHTRLGRPRSASAIRCPTG